MQLIEISPIGKMVFVGDTHGDLEASKKIIDRYLKPNFRICFLGDYVDRGKSSKKNIDFLLKQKQKHPKKIYLLQGNHEGKMICDVFPRDFWENLSLKNREKYGKIFGNFPLALGVGSILAVHGALPNINKLIDFNKIKNGDANWKNIVWGDFLESSEESEFYPREAYFQDYFNDIMNKLGKQVLIRGHDPYVPNSMYNGRCITLFTSSSYNRRRKIAIADFTRIDRINSVDDLIIEEI